MPPRRRSHVATLRSLPQEVVLATGLFLDGDLEAAEALVRAFLLKHGDHIEAMRLLARIGIAHKVYFDAEVLLAAAARAGAGLPRSRARNTPFVLVELHRYQEAREQLDQLLRDEPDSRRAQDALRGRLRGTR